MRFTRLLAATCLLLSANAMADDVRDLREEVRDLRREVRELREEVRQLRRNQGDHRGNAPSRDDDRTWGCYLQDIRAGAFYGTGRTEGEARGKTLEACSRKGGACFSNQVKCTRD